MKRILTTLPTVLLITSFATATAHAIPPNQIVDNANGTLQNVSTQSPEVSVIASRYTNYQIEPAEYYYKANVIGFLEPFKEDKCLIKKDTEVIKKVPCSWKTGFETEMKESGTYAVTTAKGEKIASWVFNKPAEFPAALAPAECVIKEVSLKTRKGIVTSFTIKTNNKCDPKTGDWSYSYSQRNVSGSNLGSGGLIQTNPTTLKGYNFIEKETVPLDIPEGSKIEIKYSPKSLTQNTAAVVVMMQ